MLGGLRSPEFGALGGVGGLLCRLRASGVLEFRAAAELWWYGFRI